MFTIHTNEERTFTAHVDDGGVQPNYTSGYTFTFYVLNPTTFATLLTKTTGIVGKADGMIDISLTGAELTGAGVTATTGGETVYPVRIVPRLTAGSVDGPEMETFIRVVWGP